MNKSKKTRKEEEDDEKFALALKEVEDEILETLKNVSALKSEKIGTVAEFKLDMILHCKLNNLCASNCPNKSMCQYYRQIRDFFLRYGFIVFPYILFIGGFLVVLDDSMGFYSVQVKNVLFVNSTCFMQKNRDNHKKSALCVAFHEFLHAISILCLEYDLLIASINRNDLMKFASKPNYLNTLLKIYTKEELYAKNEVIHRYIANNPDTKPLLEAIFKGDSSFKPQPELHDLYYQLKDILSKLEVKG